MADNRAETFTSAADESTDLVDEADVEEAIDQIGIGRFHLEVYLVVGLFQAADAVEMGFISFVTAVLKTEWGFSEKEKATMESMVFVGMAFGAPTWGWLADRYGRRPIMLISALIVSISGLISAACFNALQLILVRFVVGFSCAGFVVAFDVFAETLPTDWRGPLTMSVTYWFAIGAIYSNLAAKYLLCSYGWRTFTVACALPTFLASVAGFFFVPESAHWLAAEKRNKEAAEVLNDIAIKNGSPMRFGTVTVPGILEEVSTMDLFRRSKLRRPLLLMMVVWFGWGMDLFGIGLMLPALFSRKTAESGRRLSVHGSQGCHGLSFDFGKILISNLGQAVGLTAGVLGINRLGRKMTQICLYVFGAIAIMGLGFPDLDTNILTAFSAAAMAAANGASAATFSHTPELFPTHARVLATGICSASTRIAAALSPYVISDLIPPLPTAAILAGSSLVAAVAVSFVKETVGAHIEDDDIQSSDGESDSNSEFSAAESG